MISPEKFYDFLKGNGVEFFTGVPDSLLKYLNNYIIDNCPKDRHIITANEGGAIALASGYHLATGKIPLIYMQNSGLGNAVNPLTSLADKEVYSIPMLLLIGWRGHPDEKDEPQHKKIGRINPDLLKSLGIPYYVMPSESSRLESFVSSAVRTARENNEPCAILVRKETFEEYKLRNKIQDEYELTRETTIKLVTEHLDERDLIVSTTGKASRELFEHREAMKHGHSRDFLTVGSMGHSSQIALGIALAKPDRNVYCLDGDGAAIMHLGGLAIIGQSKAKNFKHIILNNGSHESVGGQPTVGYNIDFLNIARACGYKLVLKAQTEEETRSGIKILKKSEGPSLLEIRISKEARKELGRPTTTPIENKNDFMENLRK